VLKQGHAHLPPRCAAWRGCCAWFSIVIGLVAALEFRDGGRAAGETLKSGRHMRYVMKQKLFSFTDDYNIAGRRREGRLLRGRPAALAREEALVSGHGAEGTRIHPAEAPETGGRRTRSGTTAKLEAGGEEGSCSRSFTACFMLMNPDTTH